MEGSSGGINDVLAKTPNEMKIPNEMKNKDVTDDVVQHERLTSYSSKITSLYSKQLLPWICNLKGFVIFSTNCMKVSIFSKEGSNMPVKMQLSSFTITTRHTRLFPFRSNCG